MTTESSHTGTLSYASPPRGRGHEVPFWAWCLAVLTFPAGMFILFGYMKALSWRRAVLLSVVCYASVTGFIPGVTYAQDGGHESLESGLSFALLCTVMAWGLCVFLIGRRAEIWAPATTRAWMYVGMLAILLLASGIVMTAIILFHVIP